MLYRDLRYGLPAAGRDARKVTNQPTEMKNNAARRTLIRNTQKIYKPRRQMRQ